MKSEKPVFTHFNFSFITFPRQVFVKMFLRDRDKRLLPLIPYYLKKRCSLSPNLLLNCFVELTLKIWNKCVFLMVFF